MLPRMRLLDEAYQEIKAMDANTAITKHFIRKLALTGKIKTVTVGYKRLINLDDLVEFISLRCNGDKSIK